MKELLRDNIQSERNFETLSKFAYRDVSSTLIRTGFKVLNKFPFWRVIWTEFWIIFCEKTRAKVCAGFKRLESEFTKDTPNELTETLLKDIEIGYPKAWGKILHEKNNEYNKCASVSGLRTTFQSVNEIALYNFMPTL